MGPIKLTASEWSVLDSLPCHRRNRAVTMAGTTAMAPTSRQAGRSIRAEPRKRAVFFQCLKFSLGAAAVVLGADLLVDSASALARLAGVSERIIGVTIVAIGTSLPELVTTVGIHAEQVNRTYPQ